MPHQDATMPAPSDPVSDGCRGPRLLGRLLPIVLLACCLATVSDRSGSAAPPSRGRGNAARFFDGLLKKVEPTPDFIALPQPPSQEEADRRATHRRQAAAPRPATPTTAKVPVRSSARELLESPATLPAKRPTSPPSWKDAVSFGTELKQAATKVVDAAADPGYKPKPKVAAPPATAVVSPSPKARRQTPPLVVTRLQPTGGPPPKTQQFERLRSRIAQTLALYQRRPLNTTQHTPWEVMHGFIAFGIPTQVRVGGPAGDPVSAIGWSNMGGRCRGQVMLAAADDRVVALKGVGVQGHSAQYLAILAQCRVAANSPLTVQGKAFTVADLIEEEKQSCKSKTELTFALIALAHYLPTDATWISRDGGKWFGLAYGCQRRLRSSGQLDGPYLRADKYVRDYQNFAVTKLQNRDGSFSTEWFKYAADRDDDIDRKIQTTGHILEWLVSSLDQNRLYEPRVVAAAEFLCGALASEPSREWKIGPLGHALHALNIYQERAWGIVLPGGIAAYNGSMKAAADPALMADKPGASSGTSTRR